MVGLAEGLTEGLGVGLMLGLAVEGTTEGLADDGINEGDVLDLTEGEVVDRILGPTDALGEGDDVNRLLGTKEGDLEEGLAVGLASLTFTLRVAAELRPGLIGCTFILGLD